VLLTRSRLCPRPKPGSSLHLHVLGTPPAFVLSQDQTLREELLPSCTKQLDSQRAVRDTPVCASGDMHRANLWACLGGSGPCVKAEARSTHRTSTQDGSILAPSVEWPRMADRATASNLDTLPAEGRPRVRMLLSFQRPSHLFRKADSFPRGRAESTEFPPSSGGPTSIAPDSGSGYPVPGALEARATRLSGR
jgi:hypothetical protein